MHFACGAHRRQRTAYTAFKNITAGTPQHLLWYLPIHAAAVDLQATELQGRQYANPNVFMAFLKGLQFGRYRKCGTA